MCLKTQVYSSDGYRQLVTTNFIKNFVVFHAMCECLLNHNKCEVYSHTYAHECFQTLFKLKIIALLMGSVSRSLALPLCLFIPCVLHTDIDECSEGTHQCDHNCHNNVGSYTCSCRTGYRLAADGRSCVGKETPHVSIVC